MLDHLEIQTLATAETEYFYVQVLAPLGYEMQAAGKGAGFAQNGRFDFFIVRGTPSANVHFAFETPTRAKVDEIYALAGANGFACDRAPALAPQVHANYYAGYLRDPDGRLVEFVCQKAK